MSPTFLQIVHIKHVFKKCTWGLALCVAPRTSPGQGGAKHGDPGPGPPGSWQAASQREGAAASGERWQRRHTWASWPVPRPQHPAPPLHPHGAGRFLSSSARDFQGLLDGTRALAWPRLQWSCAPWRPSRLNSCTRPPPTQSTVAPSTGSGRLCGTGLKGMYQGLMLLCHDLRVEWYRGDRPNTRLKPLITGVGSYCGRSCRSQLPTWPRRDAGPGGARMLNKCAGWPA